MERSISSSKTGTRLVVSIADTVALVRTHACGCYGSPSLWPADGTMLYYMPNGTVAMVRSRDEIDRVVAFIVRFVVRRRLQ